MYLSRPALRWRIATPKGGASLDGVGKDPHCGSLPTLPPLPGPVLAGAKTGGPAEVKWPIDALLRMCCLIKVGLVKSLRGFVDFGKVAVSHKILNRRRRWFPKIQNLDLCMQPYPSPGQRQGRRGRQGSHEGCKLCILRGRGKAPAINRPESCWYSENSQWW
jgi:hypothetical protein